jgi:hypothetical protein
MGSSELSLEGVFDRFDRISSPPITAGDIADSGTAHKTTVPYLTLSSLISLLLALQNPGMKAADSGKLFKSALGI